MTPPHRMDYRIRVDGGKRDRWYRSDEEQGGGGDPFGNGKGDGRNGFGTGAGFGSPVANANWRRI
jgi:hypothetical protein